MRPWLTRFGRALKLIITLMVCVVAIPITIALVRVAIECRPFSDVPQTNAPARTTAAGERPTAALGNYARNEDQTYLTLPEWYIVYSADEYAAFVADNPPSQFPYFRAVGQFWSSYYDVCAVTRDQYAFNSGYHLSLAVIGVSFTVENIFKGLYEHTVGLLTESISSPALTEEDRYAQAVATEYGTFLHTVPWYEFPFSTKLGELWGNTPLWSDNNLRKWERKGVLSAEYATKAGYGWLIRQGTQSVYSSEDLEIYAWVEGISPEIVAQEPDIRIAQSLDAQTAIIVLPRYEAFTQIVPRLVQDGVRFVEIAGNDELLITVIAPQSWNYDLSAGESLFAMPILTQPERQRIAIRVPVASLHEVLRDLDSRDITVEHLYDY